jgi:glutathione S-transferase
MSPLLYSFRRCPYAMRARMALLVSNIRCELREVSLKHKPQEMISASDKATVPVLVLADGQVIDESLEIMRWALRQHDPESWLSAEGDELIALFDDRFKHHLDRYKYPDRYRSDSCRHRDAGYVLLQQLEYRLQQQRFLCGTRRQLADFAIMPFVRQYAHTDRAWFDAQALPAVQQWLQQLIGADVFAQAMHHFTIWRANDMPVFLEINSRP